MLDAGHRVIAHARDDQRAESLETVVHDGARIAIADLTDLEATRQMAVVRSWRMSLRLLAFEEPDRSRWDDRKLDHVQPPL